MLSEKIYKPPRALLASLFFWLGSFYFAVTILGYTFVPANGLWGIFFVAIVVFLTIAGVINRDEGRANIGVSLRLPRLAVFFVVARAFATGTIGPNTLTCTLITLACSMILFFSCKHHRIVRKTGLGALYSLLLAAVIFVYFVAARPADSPVPDFGSSSVRDSKMSPNSVLSAEVIDIDIYAGATGGSTRVDIRWLNSDIDLLFGTLKKNPKVIYHVDRWGESPALRWETDKVLYINERRYVIWRFWVWK